MTSKIQIQIPTIRRNDAAYLQALEEYKVVADQIVILASPDYTRSAKVYLSYVGTTEEEVKEKTEQLRDQLVRYSTGTSVNISTTPHLRSAAPRSTVRPNQLRCLQWNCCGIVAQTKPEEGLRKFLAFWDPDIVLLNEIKSKDEDLLKAAAFVGFNALRVSSTAPNNRSMRGTAILYQNRGKFVVTTGEHVALGVEGGGPAIEAIYADVQMASNGKKYRFICSYVRGHSENNKWFDHAKDKFITWADQTTIVTGDLNMAKSKYRPLFEKHGFIDTLKSEWATNKSKHKTSEIDYVMRHRSLHQSSVLCHKPVQPDGCVNAHCPIPFVVGEGVCVNTRGGYCMSGACGFECDK